MLAILYIIAATHFGDRICGRFYRFTSLHHRLAASFLVGSLLSTWIIYLGSLAFSRLGQPLIAGNLIFLLVFALACYKLPWLTPSHPRRSCSRPSGSAKWDWVFIGAFLVFACWLMFATLSFKDGQFQISFKSFTDFGANVSLVQSFALGRNFPTEHPFFPGELIRYHFLFWFQAANLEFLGLNPVWSINLLSILSLVSLLMLIMTFAEILFDSRVVGRIAAALFFFSTSLSYIPFLKAQQSISGAVSSIARATEFLASGYPFRGETWGALSVNVFAFQRHLIGGIGLLFVVMTFFVKRYHALSMNRQEEGKSEPGSVNPTNQSESPASSALSETSAEVNDDVLKDQPVVRSDPFRADLGASIFSGFLIGLLPYWNSPVFLSALVIFGSALLLLPHRLKTGIMLGVAVAVGLPQVLLLRSGNVVGESLLHWGYTLENPTPILVVKYLAWTFGLKWILIAIALVLLSGFRRRLFVALSSLLVVVFTFRLSVDIFNNHKLLNIWATFASVFAAYALWRIGRKRVFGTALAIVLAAVTIFGGVVDLFPLHNDLALAVPYENDRLTRWLRDNTQPTDVFLTHTLLTHPIVFNGRKIFMGYTLYAWTAGYDVRPREAAYRQMFQEHDPAELMRLLNVNKIAYVAIDDGVRNNNTLLQLNETVYQQHFERVFEDVGSQYDNLVIYKVPWP